MDSRGYTFLECNGITVHPATHSGTALVVVAVAVVISMTKRDDHNGQGPLGPTCGYHRGLPVSPATTHHTVIQLVLVPRVPQGSWAPVLVE